jgi:hypothetical protein
MTHIETLKLALEYLQDNQHLIADNERHAYVMEYGAFIERLCQAIEQAEQAQPVALSEEWQSCVKLPVTVHVRAQRPGETHVSTREGITPVKPDDLIMRGVSGEEYPIGREIFEKTYQLGEAPPRQPRVGLTDDEVDRLWNESAPSPHNFARAIIEAYEAKNGIKENT